MKYFKYFLLFSVCISLFGCQTMGGGQYDAFKQEASSLRFKHCSDVNDCDALIKRIRGFIDRYQYETLASYDRHQVDSLKVDLDQLKYEGQGFPKYCSSVSDCKEKISQAEQILKNIPPPYANKYPVLRKITLERMESDLVDLKESQKRYAYADNLKKKPGVKIGMTAKQVIEGSSWGKPQSVNRTTTANGVREQWVYGSGNYLYFHNGILQSIQN